MSKALLCTMEGGQTTYETQSLPLEFSRENKMHVCMCSVASNSL